MRTILSTIQSEKVANDMKRYPQHGSVSTSERCENVAKLSYYVNTPLRLDADLKYCRLARCFMIFTCTTGTASEP